jgi:1,4-alpha-glucan branching enzyme
MRELLLAQASDWAFLLQSGTADRYAEQAVYDRLARFNCLLDGLRKNRIDERQLTALEIMDAVFPELQIGQILPEREPHAPSTPARTK